MGHRLSLLSVLLALPLACAPVAEPPTQGKASARLPDVVLSTLDGTPTNLTRAIGGKPALVSFWATWCDACLSEIPALERLSLLASHRGGVVVGVAVGEERGVVSRFVSEHRLGYARFLDGNFALSDALGERRVPTTLVVDRSGRVVYRGGALDEDALEAFRAVLAGFIHRSK